MDLHLSIMFFTFYILHFTFFHWFTFFSAPVITPYLSTQIYWHKSLIIYWWGFTSWNNTHTWCITNTPPPTLQPTYISNNCFKPGLTIFKKSLEIQEPTSPLFLSLWTVGPPFVYHIFYILYFTFYIFTYMIYIFTFLHWFTFYISNFYILHFYIDLHFTFYILHFTFLSLI